MISKFEIRENQSGDVAGIGKLYETAFPDEDLFPLVRKLLDIGPDVVSLVAVHETVIVGHISFTFCSVEESEEKVALLAPLAVAPTVQKQGIGSALVQTGFKNLKAANTDTVFVLGDPAYYSRFGFQSENIVSTPYRLPGEWHSAWRSLKLLDTDTVLAGKLFVPEAWQQKALWLP